MPDRPPRISRCSGEEAVGRGAGLLARGGDEGPAALRERGTRDRCALLGQGGERGRDSTSTASTSPESRATSTARASGSCSACASMSAAIVLGAESASAITRSSEGPAELRCPPCRRGCACGGDIAAARPTTMSRASTGPQPKARAAIAGLPPRRETVGCPRGPRRPA